MKNYRLLALTALPGVIVVLLLITLSLAHTQPETLPPYHGPELGDPEAAAYRPWSGDDAFARVNLDLISASVTNLEFAPGRQELKLSYFLPNACTQLRVAQWTSLFAPSRLYLTVYGVVSPDARCAETPAPAHAFVLLQAMPGNYRIWINNTYVLDVVNSGRR